MTLLLDAAAVARALAPEAALAAVEGALAATGQGRAVSAPKSVLALPGQEGSAVLAMPAWLGDEGAVGVKWVGSFAANPARGLPRVRGVILLADAATGDLLAVLEATRLTALRTGALAAVAARFSARADAAVAGVVGFGAVGRAALDALRLVRPLREARVYGRRPDVLAARAAEAARATGLRVRPVGSVREAVEGADIVVTATGLGRDEPLVRAGWVGPGALVVGLGSQQELDADLLTGADRLVVDSWEECARRGQLGPLVRAGRLSRERVSAELPEIVAGRRPGRLADAERIVAVCLGLGALDLALAAQAYRGARAAGLGQPVVLE